MKEIDYLEDFQSPHEMDYDHLLEHVIMGDHELLRLDSALREAFSSKETLE